MSKVDDKFFSRTDAHIHLANEQLNASHDDDVGMSIMYAAARFNIWVTACKAVSGDELEAHRAQTIDYFVEKFRLMLEDHHHDYRVNFAKYMDERRDG